MQFFIDDLCIVEFYVLICFSHFMITIFQIIDIIYINSLCMHKLSVAYFCFHILNILNSIFLIDQIQNNNLIINTIFCLMWSNSKASIQLFPISVMYVIFGYFIVFNWNVIQVGMFTSKMNAKNTG